MEKQNILKDAEKRKRLLWGGAFLLLLLLQLLLLIYYGSRKSGFHEDEFYSYYSTNKTAGLFVNDREWIDKDSYRNEFVVLPGEQFRYGIVKQMQSWDVHPPLYYYILHTVCSLFPGVFSKWLGIAVNLTAFVPCFFLLAGIVYEIAGKGEKGVRLAFLTCLLWGGSAAVISGVMFIRMYQWMTLFVLLCTWLHVRAVRKQKFGLPFLIPVGVTVFLGFLTQYFYMVFHFFLGAAFCVYLLSRKKIRVLLSYGAACVLAFGLAVLYYPASMSHIFRGYRGTEAMDEFADTGNTLERLQFFTELFDKYEVAGCLAVILLVICLLWVTRSCLGRREKLVDHPAGRRVSGRLPVEIWLLVSACAGYFFIVAKTALLLGETSNRYMLPIYGLLLFLLLYFLTEPLSGFLPEGKKTGWILFCVLCAGVLLMNGISLKAGRVFFLYEEERAAMAFVRENKDVPVVVFYNSASESNVWRLSDELMEYPEIYLASEDNMDELTDETLNTSDRVLAYVADHESGTACLDRLLESNAKLTEYRLIAEKGLWKLYELR